MPYMMKWNAKQSYSNPVATAPDMTLLVNSALHPYRVSKSSTCFG